MDRLLVISADCHAAARWPDYEPYFERAQLDAFRDWYGAGQKLRKKRPGEDRLFDTKFLDELDATDGVGGGASGTWDPKDNWEKSGGRIYSTSLRLLMLEIYFRHLPLYRALDQ